MCIQKKAIGCLCVLIAGMGVLPAQASQFNKTDSCNKVVASSGPSMTLDRLTSTSAVYQVLELRDNGDVQHRIWFEENADGSLSPASVQAPNIVFLGRPLFTGLTEGETTERWFGDDDTTVLRLGVDEMPELYASDQIVVCEEQEQVSILVMAEDGHIDYLVTSQKTAEIQRAGLRTVTSAGDDDDPSVRKIISDVLNGILDILNKDPRFEIEIEIVVGPDGSWSVRVHIKGSLGSGG